MIAAMAMVTILPGSLTIWAKECVTSGDGWEQAQKLLNINSGHDWNNLSWIDYFWIAITPLSVADYGNLYDSFGVP